MRKFILAVLTLFALADLCHAQNPGLQIGNPHVIGDCLKYGPSAGQASTVGGPCGGSGGSPGGANGDVQFNNAGVFGGLTNTQLTARLNLATAALQGALPAWPNNTTTWFRGDGTYAAVPFAAVTGALGCGQLPALTTDVSNSSCAITVLKVNGNAMPSGVADNQIPIGNGASNFIFAGIPNCPAGTLNYTAATHTFACGGAPGGGVTSFNARTGVVVPAVGDYPIAKNGTGVTNLLGFTMGLQPLKHAPGVIAVNPGTWANNLGTATFNSTIVQPADLTTAGIQWTPTAPQCAAVLAPTGCTIGGQVSGALNTGGTSTDNTEVFLYLIHRNSDNRTALIGSQSDTQGTSQTFTATATSPGIITTGAAHGLRKRMPVYVSNSGGALPAPLGTGVQYYVCTVPSPTTFSLATSIANVNSASCLPFSTTGSGTNTAAWGVQNDIDFQLGAGIATFDRRLPWFAFVWQNGWGSIPNFTVPAQTPTQALLYSMSDTGANSWCTGNLNPGAAFVTRSFASMVPNIARQVLFHVQCPGGGSGGQCFMRTTSSGGSTFVADGPVGRTGVNDMWFATDSDTNVDISATGTANINLCVKGYTQMDPS